MSRVSDPRAAQYWDKGRLISRALGEHDRRSIVWDHIAVYSPGELWGDRPPPPMYEGGPVVHVKEPASTAIRQALGEPM